MFAGKVVPAIGIIALFIVLACLIPAAPASAGGIGVAPSRLELSQALRGGEYDRSIWIFNPGDDPAGYALRASGDEGAWVRFYEGPQSDKPIDRVTVPANDKTEVLVRFTIPEQAANGTYQVTIVVSTAPPELNAGGASIKAGQGVSIEAESAVTIKVTGQQMLSAVVDEFVATDTEVNYPVRINVHVRNTGNVAARPNITATIYQGPTLIASETVSNKAVKPEGKEPIPVELATKGWREGDYVARMTVSLGDSSTRTGQVIADQDVPFKVLPIGTLTRSGELVQLIREGEAVEGWTIRIHATFANIGQIETPAVLAGEAYRDGVLVSNIDSREVLVLPRQQAELLSYLNLEQPGNYTIKGRVNFGGKLSNEKDLAFTVLPSQENAAAAPKESKPGSNMWILLAVGDAVVVLVIIIGVLVVAQRRKRRQAA
ncbi:MAG: hypothetical protein M1370_00140 [Bacteroidetes bacterium]|nr:hypothetical protein [Bacteroidota bacterium]MCL5025400.1 hypothetical protein [Chloroflexota bacterium]